LNYGDTLRAELYRFSGTTLQRKADYELGPTTHVRNVARVRVRPGG
jgi:hypothetical protein